MQTAVYGNVVCGFPSPGEENREEPLDFNDFLVKHKSTTFCLRAYGDSMSPFIMSDDILVVDRSLAPRPDDIVIAESNGDFTVKYLRKDRAGFVLVPENSSYEIIRVGESTRIFGVVTSIVRQTRR